jgi:IclR family acetate operon transcriptional repressor
VQNNHRIVKRPTHAIESVENALRILVLLQERDSLRIVDAAGELGVAPSTAHRLLATLVYRGFAVQDGRKHYAAGPNLRLDAARNPARKLVAALRPHLEALAAEAGETVNLVERIGTSARYRHSVEGPRLLRIGDRTGTILPAHTSSGGLAALSMLPESDVAQLYRGRASRRGGRDLDAAGLARLLHELAEVRTRGYALNIGRTEPELAAVGAPVGILANGTSFALSLSAPISRAGDLQGTRVVSLLQATCQQVRKELNNLDRDPAP